MLRCGKRFEPPGVGGWGGEAGGRGLVAKPPDAVNDDDDDDDVLEAWIDIRRLTFIQSNICHVSHIQGS